MWFVPGLEHSLSSLRMDEATRWPRTATTKQSEEPPEKDPYCKATTKSLDNFWAKLSVYKAHTHMQHEAWCNIMWHTLPSQIGIWSHTTIKTYTQIHLVFIHVYMHVYMCTYMSTCVYWCGTGCRDHIASAPWMICIISISHKLNLWTMQALYHYHLYIPGVHWLPGILSCYNYFQVCIGSLAYNFHMIIYRCAFAPCGTLDPGSSLSNAMPGSERTPEILDITVRTSCKKWPTGNKS